MAGVAVFREDGLDLRGEIDLFPQREGRQENYEDRQIKTHIDTILGDGGFFFKNITQNY